MAALLGARAVTITDLPPLLPLLVRNAESNAACCEVRALDWCAEGDAHLDLDRALDEWQPPPDLIIGSDITCFVQHLPELAWVVERLAAPRDARVVFAHHDRGGDSAELRGVFGRRFACERLMYGNVDGPVHIYLMKLRPDRPSGADDEPPCGVGGVSEQAISRASRGDIRDLKRLILSGCLE